MHSFFCFSINHSSSELRQLLPVSHTSTVCVWAGNSRGTANLNAAVSPQFDMVSKLSPRKSLAVPRTLHSRDQMSEPTSDQVRMDRMDLGQCTYIAKRPDTARSMLTCVFDRGAACEAAKEGIPSIAFSGRSGSQVSFTTLSDPTSTSSIAANNYAALSLSLASALLQSPSRPILPTNVTLNVNLPSTSSTVCPTPSSFTFVLTRVTTASSRTPPDVSRCGTTRLPTEASVLGLPAGSCIISVSVMDANTKRDVDAATQAVVLSRIEDFLGCLPN